MFGFVEVSTTATNKSMSTELHALCACLMACNKADPIVLCTYK